LAGGSVTMPPMGQPPGVNAKPPPKPIHVALVAGPESLDRLGVVVRHMIVGLLDEAIRVSLVCPVSAGADHLAPPAEVVRYAPTRVPLLLRRSAHAVAHQIRPAGVGCLHALDAGALPLTRRLAAEANLDYLVGIDALRRHVRPPDGRCRGVVAAAEPIRRRLGVQHALPEDQIHLIRPGIHAARQATCFADPQHTVAIVAAGRPASPAPFGAALNAFAELRAARRDCVFFLVGAGRAERPLRRLAQRLDLMGDLTFVDRSSAEQLTDILKAADVFIAPAPADRIDVELLSAMAGGVPALAGIAGQPQADQPNDFVIPDQTALTFAAGNAAELTVKLAALLDDRAAARRLAEAALDHLRQHHSPARNTKQLADLYRACVRPAG